MKYKKYVFIVMIILSLAACIGIKTIQIARAKRRIQQNVSVHINQFLEQQHLLLQRLGKQLLPAIQSRDFAYISQQLRTYEDQIFMLSKQGWIVPMRVQWVLLNVPLHIITSEGEGSAELLAPDQNYYLQVITSRQLQSSSTYTKHAMPEYNLLNLGLGIEDGQYNNLGLLDVTVPLDALSAHIMAKIGHESKYFSIAIKNLSQPDITLRADYFWQIILKTNIIVILVCSIFYWLVIYGIKIYWYLRTQRQELRQLKKQLEQVSYKLSLSKNATNTYAKYNHLFTTHNASKQKISIVELLQDVQAINAELAMRRNITTKFPQQCPVELACGDQIRLMQVLSGILHEMLQQLPSDSTLEVQVQINEPISDQHKITFKFIDDGFYNELSTKAWKDIQYLVDLEGGLFEHVHTAYSGNTIKVEFTMPFCNNVIHLDRYLVDV